MRLNIPTVVPKNVRIALLEIARVNKLTMNKRGFVSEEGIHYYPTRLGFVSQIQENYHIRYRGIEKDVSYQRMRVKELEERIERLRDDMLHKRNRRVALDILDKYSPEEAVKKLKDYLTIKE